MPQTAPTPLLRITGLCKRFGAQEVLRDVSLDVAAGEVVALIGASGSGKSTLLRCINALEDYAAGDIRLAGERLFYTGDGAKRRRFGDRRLSAERARIGMVFQGYNLFPHFTAEENITLGLRRVRGCRKAQARDIAAHWLQRVGLAEKSRHYPHQLSGGQQQRVAIARALALEPLLLLLDEVTSALDPELVAEVQAVIREFAAGGMTMIVVSHEMGFVRDVADRIVRMQDGRIVETGSPAALFETTPRRRAG
jgi:polar amino acid transport system ATP-binding protein